MKKTFVDANVLMAAARGTPEVCERAMAILDDPGRVFVCSELLKLEVLPKASHYGRSDQVEFYQTFFDAVQGWPDSYDPIVEFASDEACTHGIAAMDALHIAAAVSLGADELVTGEKPEKPIHRTTAVKTVSLYSGYA